MQKKQISVQMIAEGGLMIALAKVLSMVTLWQMPAGGSVTLASMAPLFLFASRWGWQWGMLVGGLYGLVDLMIGGYVVHPLQVILDYPLAYAMLGLAGIGSHQEDDGLSAYLPGIALGTALRLACHILSGCIFYSTIDFTKGGASLAQALTWSNMASGFGYSFTYNGSFLGVDFLICLVALFIFWNPLQRILRSRR